MTERYFRRVGCVPLILIAISVVCALTVATAALMLFPDRLIGPVAWVTRTSADQSMIVTWKPSDGDVYAALPGQVRPPADDTPYAMFEIAWDAGGFRVPAQAYDAYPVAVFGDSFTEGFNVEFPYPDRLAEHFSVGVRNYGYRAYGPVEVAEAATDFAAGEPRSWVIWGYFSGNDLGDAVRDPRIDAGNPAAVWSALLDKLRPNPTPAPMIGEDGQARYNQPLPVIIGGNYYDIAFVSYYGWWQQLPPDYARSRNWEQVIAVLDSFDAALPPQTCRAVVFIPPKEMIYYRYIYPSERQFVNAANQRMNLLSNDTLGFTPAPVAEEDETAFLDSLYTHRDAMRALVESRLDWTFIDLTPAFEQAAAEGVLLYYPYDTHWNQAGHDLAARVIADAIEARDGEC